MNTYTLLVLGIIVIAIGTCGCMSSPPLQPLTPTPLPPTTTPPLIPTLTPTLTATGIVAGAEQSVIEANNRFAFDVYATLRTDPAMKEKNLFFSPFSMSSALAITYEGARGSTADEIQRVFHLPKDRDMRQQGYAALIAGMNKEQHQYTLRTANALWAEQTYPFLPDYIRVAQLSYYGKVTNLDFITAPEESRATINRWVEDQTNDKIRNLLPNGAINSLTRLVITNAIYFYGTWVKQFDKEKTNEADFWITPEKSTRVHMMERTDRDAIFNYTETDTLQMLEMPYAHGNGKSLSMIVILPKGDNLTAVEGSLNRENLSLWSNVSVPEMVEVYVPRFKLETKYNLKDTLTAMGMPTAFSADADLSGMDGSKNLYITEVIHQAFVDVNEEGTEAAAATGVVVGITSLPPPVSVFRADHPFIFLIQDNENGNILFMGRVVNPNG